MRSGHSKAAGQGGRLRSGARPRRDPAPQQLHPGSKTLTLAPGPAAKGGEREQLRESVGGGATQGGGHCGQARPELDCDVPAERGGTMGQWGKAGASPAKAA